MFASSSDGGVYARAVQRQLGVERLGRAEFFVEN